MDTTRLSKHRMYPTWNAMIARCTKPHHKSWSNYGGRGITVCEDWMPPKEIGFVNFVRDMIDSHPELFNGNPYSPDYFHAGKTLDRRNEGQGYNVDNCRWVTYAVQNINRRSAIAGRKLPQGVSWKAPKNKFQSYYVQAGKYHSLGYYTCLLDAVAARRRWETVRCDELGADDHGNLTTSQT